jgi:hypothetical protein
MWIFVISESGLQVVLSNGVFLVAECLRAARQKLMRKISCATIFSVMAANVPGVVVDFRSGLKEISLCACAMVYTDFLCAIMCFIFP